MSARHLKTLVLLLALLALPLRGVAAVAMWHCAQDRAPSASAAAETAGHPQPGSHHDDRETAAAHDHASAHGHEPPAEDPHAGHQPAPASSCSACAVCCIGVAAMPLAWPTFSFAPPGAIRIPVDEQRFTGVVPARLDRPPLSRPL